MCLYLCSHSILTWSLGTSLISSDCCDRPFELSLSLRSPILYLVLELASSPVLDARSALCACASHPYHCLVSCLRDIRLRYHTRTISPLTDLTRSGHRTHPILPL